MRIKEISATNISPVETFIADDLKDLVVIACPNGVGNTRLISGILNYFQNPGPNRRGANPSFIIEATDQQERDVWGQPKLGTKIPEQATTLQKFLQQVRRRRNFRNSVLYYESNRTIQQVKPLAFDFDMPDPWEENVAWNVALGGLSSRWQDTHHVSFPVNETVLK